MNLYYQFNFPNAHSPNITDSFHFLSIIRYYFFLSYFFPSILFPIPGFSLIFYFNYHFKSNQYKISSFYVN